MFSGRIKCTKLKRRKKNLQKQTNKTLSTDMYSARTEEHIYSGISQLNILFFYIYKKSKTITICFLKIMINTSVGFEVGLTLPWIAAWT